MTKDRKGQGLLLRNDLVRNFSLFALDKFAAPFIDKRKERAAFDAAAERFDLRAASPDMAAGSLSGGNQQKLLLAKVLEIEPEIVIVNEPTRDIDVGAKVQIYGFIAGLIATGCAVIVLSSELPEISQMDSSDCRKVDRLIAKFASGRTASYWDFCNHDTSKLR